MRLQDGKIVRHYKGAKPVFITDGVDVRVTDSKNGSHIGNRLLRKFEFLSQDEMHNFVSVNQPKIGTESKCDELTESWNESAKKQGFKTYFYQREIEKDGSWAFGTSEESDDSTKTDKLLEDGRSTTSVKKIIRKTLKDIRLAGVDKMLNERFESVKRKRVWCEDGSELDIDRIMTGDPDHWIKTKRNGKKRVINIGINTSASCGNGASVFAKNVALAYVTAEALENLGYGVKITAINSSYYSDGGNGNSSHETASTFPLKRATEPVDIERVGSIGLPSMLRYYGFVTDGLIHRQTCGYCWDMSDEMKGFLNIDILVSTSWSTGDAHAQARKISRVIEKTINQ
tara:strand:+ start:4585 stop:5613 length:1029 start_codon:yes stop_codon:yes gene_type:complete